MPRKKRALKRPGIQPDRTYSSETLEKFINYVMFDGRKGPARQAVYGAMTLVEKQLGKPPLQIFTQAIKNVSPVVQVRTRRVGGANYQVPTQVSPERRKFLAMRWIILAARDRKEKSMAERLAAEFMAALKNEGGAMKKREQVHRMAEANKAFAYMAW